MFRIRQFAQLSFAIKIDIDSELPEMYCPPCEPVAGMHPRDGKPIYQPHEESVRRWHPVVGGLEVDLLFGRGRKQPFVVRTVELSHARCSAVGYILSERKSKLRRDLYNTDANIAREAVIAAKARGEQVTVEVDCPIVAFICDTSVAALTRGTGPQAELILSSPILMIECSYLAADMEEEAAHRGHIVWTALFPLVKDKLLRNRDRKARKIPISMSSDVTDSSIIGEKTHESVSNLESEPYFTLILIHFSLRYTDTDIINFFLTESGFSCVTARKQNIEVLEVSSAGDNINSVGQVKKKGLRSGAEMGPPADIVLWLDSGVVELDVA